MNSSSSSSSLSLNNSSATNIGLSIVHSNSRINNNNGQPPPLSTNSDHSLDRHSPFSTTIIGGTTPSAIIKQLPFSTNTGMSITTPGNSLSNNYSSIGGSEMPAFLAYETSNYGSSIHHDDPGISTGLLLTRGVLDSATDSHHHHPSSSSSTNIMGSSSSSNANTYTSFSSNNGFSTFSHQTNNNSNRIIRDGDDAFSDDNDDDGPGFEIGGVDNGAETSTTSSVITNHSMRNGRKNISTGIDDNDVVDNNNVLRNSSSSLYTGSGSIDYTHEDLPPHPADTPLQLSSASTAHAHLRNSQSNHRSITSSISSALAGNTSIKNSLNIVDGDVMATGFTTIDKLHANGLNTTSPGNNFNTFENNNNNNNHGENNSTGYVYSPEDTSSTVGNNINGMNVTWPSTGGKKRDRQTVTAATLAAKAAAEAVAVAAAVSASGQAIFYTESTASGTKKKSTKGSNTNVPQNSDLLINNSSTSNDPSSSATIDSLSSGNNGNNLATKFNETTGSPRRGKAKKIIENTNDNSNTTVKSSISSTSSLGAIVSSANSVNNDAVSTTTSASVSVTGTPTSVGRARKKSRVENNGGNSSNTIDSSSDVPTDQDGTFDGNSNTLVKANRPGTIGKGRRPSLKNSASRLLPINSSSSFSSSSSTTLTATNPNMLSIGSGGSLDAYAMTLVMLPAPDNNIKSLTSGYESTPSGDIDYTHGIVFPPGTLARSKDPIKDGVRATHTLVERTLTHVEGNWTLIQDYVVSGHRIPITDNCMVPLSDPGPNRICPGYCGYIDLYTKLTFLARMSTRQILSIGLRSYNRLPCAMWVDPSKVLGEFFVVSFTLPGFFPSCQIHGTDKKSVKWKKSGSPQMRPMELSETHDAATIPVQLMSQFAVARCIKTNVKLYSARVSCVVKDHMAQGIFMVQVRDARENHQPLLVSNSTATTSNNVRSSTTDDDDE